MNKSDEDLINQLFKKKKEFHHKQAALSIEEKIKILVKLQEIYITLQTQRGIKTDKIVWKL
ncbi:MAG: hypothetical protein JXB88_07560 [Spirochaetales bacterium]|nr:hypothetical protein [Spirochaetales bacterium]